MFDLKSLVKYLLEGLAVAVAAFYLPKKKTSLKEVSLIALTAATVFAVLDMFAPSIALSARQGSGFGIGMNMVGGDGETDSNKLDAVKRLVCDDSSESDSDSSDSNDSSESDSDSESDVGEMVGGSAEYAAVEEEAHPEPEDSSEPHGVSFCAYSPAPIENTN